MPKVNHICIICNKEFISYRETQKTCSKVCMGKNQLGEKNPNKHKWTDEERLKQSKIIKSKVDDEYRKKAGSANRDKKFSKERIKAMHDHRTKESYIRSLPKSETTKKKIGIASSAKFTGEYKEKQRQKMIKNGYWISDELKSDWEIYFKHAHWIKPMWELVDKEVLKEHGIYNSYTNRKGLVRDHKFSRLQAFEMGIFPEILRHPTNCEIIKHGENSSKRRKCSKTLEELFSDIENYTCAWDEQVLVCSLITRWKNGERFSAENYRRKLNNA